jgi:hypothetical protein
MSNNELTTEDLRFLNAEKINTIGELAQAVCKSLSAASKLKSEDEIKTFMDKLLSIKNKALNSLSITPSEEAIKKSESTIELLSDLMNIPKTAIKLEVNGIFSLELNPTSEYGLRKAGRYFQSIRSGNSMILHHINKKNLRKITPKLLSVCRLEKNLKELRQCLKANNINFSVDHYDVTLSEELQEIPPSLVELQKLHRINIYKPRDGKQLIRLNTSFLMIKNRTHRLYSQINDRIKRYRIMSKKPRMRKGYVLLWPTLTLFREAINEEAEKGSVESIDILVNILWRIYDICEDATDMSNPRNLLRHHKGLQFFEMTKNNIERILNNLELVKSLDVD